MQGQEEDRAPKPRLTAPYSLSSPRKPQGEAQVPKRPHVFLGFDSTSEQLGAASRAMGALRLEGGVSSLNTPCCQSPEHPSTPAPICSPALG